MRCSVLKKARRNRYMRKRLGKRLVNKGLLPSMFTKKRTKARSVALTEAIAQLETFEDRVEARKRWGGEVV